MFIKRFNMAAFLLLAVTWAVPASAFTDFSAEAGLLQPNKDLTFDTRDYGSVVGEPTRGLYISGTHLFGDCRGELCFGAGLFGASFEHKAPLTPAATADIAQNDTDIADLNADIAALDETSATYEADKAVLENDIALLQADTTQIKDQHTAGNQDVGAHLTVDYPVLKGKNSLQVGADGFLSTDYQIPAAHLKYAVSQTENTAIGVKAMLFEDAVSTALVVDFH